MFRDILTSRAILAGFLFFLLVVISSLLYNWHVRREIAAELTRPDPVIQQLENKKEKYTAQDARVSIGMDRVGGTRTPLEVGDTQARSEETDPIIDEVSENLDIVEAFFPDETIGEAPAEEVRVSLFGFGTYPEVPPDFPLSVVWEAPEEHQAQMPSDLLEELELLGFVMIKKWKEGDHDFVGAFMANGKVYPTYPDVAYVKWDKTQESGEWRVSEVSTVDSTISEQLLNGVFPPGIEIVDQDSSGIDPHKFLSQ